MLSIHLHGGEEFMLLRGLLLNRGMSDEFWRDAHKNESLGIHWI